MEKLIGSMKWRVRMERMICAGSGRIGAEWRSGWRFVPSKGLFEIDSILGVVVSITAKSEAGCGGTAQSDSARPLRWRSLAPEDEMNVMEVLGSKLEPVISEGSAKASLIGRAGEINFREVLSGIFSDHGVEGFQNGLGIAGHHFGNDTVGSDFDHPGGAGRSVSVNNFLGRVEQDSERNFELSVPSFERAGIAVEHADKIDLLGILVLFTQAFEVRDGLVVHWASIFNEIKHQHFVLGQAFQGVGFVVTAVG
jgi:hypothetical protein